MAQVNHFTVIEVAPQSAAKSTATDDKGNQIMQAIADRANILISTTTPVTVAATVFNRAYEFKLTNDGSPPVADFIVRFASQSSLHRGQIKVVNNTSYDATLEVTSQASPKPVLESGQTGYFDLFATEILEGPGSGSAGSSGDWKDSVLVASTANGTLATAFENGDTLDGETLSTGDRILLKDQTTGSENGIYTVNASGAPTRSTDADTDARVTSGLSVHVEKGTANGNKNYQITTDDPITVDTTSIVFAEIAGGGGGGTIAVEDDGGSVDPTVDTLNFVGFDVVTDGTDQVKITRVPSGQDGGGGLIEVAAKDFGAASATTWDVDVTGYDDVQVRFETLGMSVAGALAMRTSTDGATFESTAGDYQVAFMHDGTQGENATDTFVRIGQNGAQTTGAWGFAHVYNISSADYCVHIVGTGYSTVAAQAIVRTGYRTVAEANTHLRFLPSNGGSLNAGTIRVMGTKADAGQAVNVQTGTTYTIILSDGGNLITMDNASANTLTIPTNATTAFAIGTTINVLQKGAGTTTVDATTAVNLNGTSSGGAAISARWDEVTIKKIGTDDWIIRGDHGAVA